MKWVCSIALAVMVIIESMTAASVNSIKADVNELENSVNELSDRVAEVEKRVDALEVVYESIRAD